MYKSRHRQNNFSVPNKYILIILIIYELITIYATINNNIFYTNFINPTFWAGIIIYLIWNIKKNYIRFNNNKQYYINMMIISCIYATFYFYTGFIFGFSKSPYNHSIIPILKNIIIQILPIIGIEITRSVFLNRNRDNKLLQIFLTILLILLEINYHILISLYPNKEHFFQYICSNILPLIAGSCLYTYLTLKGTFILPLMFRLVSELVILLLPILPNLDWFGIGSMGILTPILIYLLFKFKFTKIKKDIKSKQKNLYEKIIYVITLTICISLVCFMLGLFKYEPITILSNSMMPQFSRGDVVIFKKINDTELKKIPINSIIIYTIGEKNIAHRVVDKIENDGTVLYQTKGDKNNTPDGDLVAINQIKGVYVFNIKYIGYPSVWLYEYFNQ